MKKLFFAFLIIVTQQLSAQPADSCSLRISLLTCTPGDELYSTFGHSALRVTDRQTGMDTVFNYGTFDFEDPIKFYKKFVRGKLLYFVSKSSLNEFLYEYDYFGRGVTEQVLNLGCDEKQRFITALFENAKEENKYYRYDFNYDNCTTRLRDMLEKITGQPLQTTTVLTTPRTTFRDLIHEYLDRGHQYWSKLGIDILLGSPLDKKVTNREAMFLPDYLMLAFDSGTIRGSHLVTEKIQILPTKMPTAKKPFFTPLIVFSLLFAIVLALTLFPSKASTKFFRIFDPLFFLLVSLLGLLLLFMWFATEHAMAKNNFNLLWALPTHIVTIFFIFSKKPWVKAYFRIVSWLSLALVATWFFLPQEINVALLPIVAIQLVRSWIISKSK